MARIAPRKRSALALPRDRDQLTLELEGKSVALTNLRKLFWSDGLTKRDLLQHLLHFDLDPTPGASFDDVRAAALLVREPLAALGMKVLVKTTGSRGLHLYVPIERGPTQKQVWGVAKQVAFAAAAQHPELLIAEYRVAKRPSGRVLVDYSQNAWGRTLASIYSSRPRPCT
jgi:DNA primase